MIYTPPKNVWGGLFLAGNHDYHKNWVPFILPHNLCLILMGMKQKPWNFCKKILRIVRFENLSFFESAIMIFFCFIPTKIKHELWGRMNGTQFFWLSWFPAKNNPPQTFLGGECILPTYTTCYIRDVQNFSFVCIAHIWICQYQNYDSFLVI